MADIDSRVAALEQTTASLLAMVKNLANSTMMKKANLVLESEINDLKAQVAGLAAQVLALQPPSN